MIGFSHLSFARNAVRAVEANDKDVRTIFLALGRSTVLKFKEKPVNVVIGNKNYYNVEYINNDITLQPLGAVDTNMFVYTKSKRTYSFLLKIVTPNRYDDIIHVHWKNNFRPRQVFTTSKVKKNTFRPHYLRYKKRFEFSIQNMLSKPDKKSYILDGYFYNKSSKKLKSKDLKIYLTRGGRKLKYQEVVFWDEVILPKRKTRVRIFTTLKVKKGFTVNLKAFKKKRKTIIYRKHL